MAFTSATSWTIDRATGDIRYIGGDHDNSPDYETVIDWYRWLQGLADDAVASGDDELDITGLNPAARATDNYVTLLNGYNVDKYSSQFLYDGSIVQDAGDTIFDGFVNFGNASVQMHVFQDGYIVADDFWNQGGIGINADSNQGISHRFLLQTRVDGVDIDGRRLLGRAQTYENNYKWFSINGTARGNNVFALADSDDLNNNTVAATVAGWTTITNTEGLRAIDVDNDGTDEDYYSEWNRDTYTINQFYERGKWITKASTAEDSNTDSGSDFVVDDATITGAAQSFSVGSNAMEVVKVTVPLKIGLGSPTGDITVAIYSHSGTLGTSSVPNALQGTSEAYEAALLTSTYREITFHFKTPVTLAASTDYCVVVEHGDGDASNYVHVEGLATTGTHGGNRSHNTAGWTAVALDDLAFAVYTAPELYGMPGHQFRGVTHSFPYDGEAGTIVVTTNDLLVWGTELAYNNETVSTFVVGEAIHEDTATPDWKGRILAVDDDGTTGTLIVDVTTGTVTTGDSFTGQTSGAKADANGTPTVVSGGGVLHCLAVDDNGADGFLYTQLIRGTAPANDVTLYYGGTDLSAADATDYLLVDGTVDSWAVGDVFLGQSTGSALIGAHGVGVEYADLSSSDKITDLGGNLKLPPNLVTNIVGGMTTGDRVMVAPWDGTTYDVEGNPAIHKGQFLLSTALTIDNVSAVVLKTGDESPVPSDTPETGWLRVTDDNGLERRLYYSAWDDGTDTFTISGGDYGDGNEDFNSVNASADNEVYIAYLDEEYDGTSSTDRFQGVKAAGSRDLVVIVRDGGVTPRKEFIQSWTLTSSNQTITASNISDA